MTQDQDPSVKARYIRSNYFRVVHTDGAFGGFTPQGRLFVGLYSERAPLPDVTTHAIEGGLLGPEILERRQAQSEGAIIREFEVGLDMSVDVAKSLMAWLKERVDFAESMKTASPEKRETNNK